MNWDEFSRDLRLARRWCDELLIHCLEGCVRQGFLTRLRSFDWDEPAAPPESASLLRRVLRGTLWASARPWRVLFAAIV